MPPKIIISGSILNFDILDFYLNGEKVKEVKTTSDTFSEEIGDLEKLLRAYRGGLIKEENGDH